MAEGLEITPDIGVPWHEVDMKAIRAQGAGGQNVNKVSSAIHLRFDIPTSSLPAWVKARLLRKPDARITQDGLIVIKAQSHRTQEKNREEAVARLVQLIRSVTHIVKRRVPTKATYGSQQQRLASKQKRGQHKKLRGRIDVD